MRSIATAWEAPATDTNTYAVDGIYNGTLTVDQIFAALAPVYIRKMPRADSWGTPFVFRASDRGRSYAIVSAGPNKRMPGSPGTDDDDIVFENGSFTKSPPEVH